MLVNIILFIIGVAFGSFLNVCIHRLPKEESIVFPSSHCPLCRAKINFYDNIPILSYILLRGRCRACNGTISIRYPLVEILSGFALILPQFLSFSIYDYGFYFSAAFLFYLIFITFSDIETQTLPDSPSFLMAIMGLSYNFLNGCIFMSFYGLLLGMGIMGAIALLGRLFYKKEALGGGDIKLAGAFGAFLLWDRLVLALFLGYLIGSIVSLVLVMSKAKKMDDYIPFAPFLALGGFIALLFGKNILIYYIANFLHY